MDVVFGRPYGGIGRGKGALVEDAYLVRLKGTDGGMQDSLVMEKDEVFLLPFVWVDKLL